MSIHNATIEWVRSESTFTDNRYPRSHKWIFDGGAVVRASSSPHSVRVPLSNPANVDPEEAYVAALSSCHMLWFLSLSATKGFVVDSYTDAAVGLMEADSQGKTAITRIILKPRIEFCGQLRPDNGIVAALHHSAHEACFLANSVRTEITVDGDWGYTE